MDVNGMKRLLKRTQRTINSLEERKQMLNGMIENRYKLARLKDKDYQLWEKAKEILKKNESSVRIRRSRRTHS